MKFRKPTAFTLIELLIASMVLAVLSAALTGIFASAIRLRERAYARIEEALPAMAALSVMRNDLTCMVVPSGIQRFGAQGQLYLAGPMLGTTNQLTFYTATGTIDEHSPAPYGDIQEVNYSLIAGSGPGGRERQLVRGVTRNLLAMSTPQPDQQRLIGGVQSLKFQYLINQIWADSWDSTANNNQAPAAVKVHIDYLSTSRDEADPQSVHLVCAVADGVTTSATSTSGGLF